MLSCRNSGEMKDRETVHSLLQFLLHFSRTVLLVQRAWTAHLQAQALKKKNKTERNGVGGHWCNYRILLQGLSWPKGCSSLKLLEKICHEVWFCLSRREQAKDHKHVTKLIPLEIPNNAGSVQAASHMQPRSTRPVVFPHLLPQTNPVVRDRALDCLHCSPEEVRSPSRNCSCWRYVLLVISFGHGPGFSPSLCYQRLSVLSLGMMSLRRQSRDMG